MKTTKYELCLWAFTAAQATGDFEHLDREWMGVAMPNYIVISQLVPGTRMRVDAALDETPEGMVLLARPLNQQSRAYLEGAAKRYSKTWKMSAILDMAVELYRGSPSHNFGELPAALTAELL